MKTYTACISYTQDGTPYRVVYVKVTKDKIKVLRKLYENEKDFKLVTISE